MIYVNKIGKSKPENIFMLLGTIFGLLWIIIFPPFQAPDEEGHFIRAYMISEGIIWPVNDSEQCGLGAYLPPEVTLIDKAVDADKLRFHPDKKQNIDDIKNALQIKSNSYQDGRLQFVSAAAMGYYSPTNYIIQSAMIFLGRNLNAPVLMTYYMSRLGNLFLFLFLGYWGIRLIPFLKLSMLTIFLLPIFLNEVASCNADVFIISVSLFFTAYVLNLAYNDKIKSISRYDLLSLFLLSMFIALAKSAYIFLLLLFFLIPSNKFSSPKGYYAYGFSVIFFGGMISAFWVLSLHFLNLNLGIPVSPKAETIKLFSHPLHFMKLAIKTLPADISTTFYLGWLDTHLPKLIKYLYVILVIAPCFFINHLPNRNSIYNLKKGVLLLGLFGIMYFEIHAALYVTWPQHNNMVEVEGLQGRYFLPFIMIFLLGIKFLLPANLYNRKLHEDKMLVVYYLTIFGLLIVSTYCVLNRYYAL